MNIKHIFIAVFAFVTIISNAMDNVTINKMMIQNNSGRTINIYTGANFLGVLKPKKYEEFLLDIQLDVRGKSPEIRFRDANSKAPLIGFYFVRNPQEAIINFFSPWGSLNDSTIDVPFYRAERQETYQLNIILEGYYLEDTEVVIAKPHIKI